MTPAGSRLHTFWDRVAIGTLVTIRRSDERRTKAWTASGPYSSDSGIDCIRVDLDGVVVGYPLDRVSFGWDEARPGAPVPLPVRLEPAPIVPLAAVLDPPPVVATRGDRFTSIALTAAVLYFVCIGLEAVAGWLLR